MVRLRYGQNDIVDRELVVLERALVGRARWVRRRVHSLICVLRLAALGHPAVANRCNGSRTASVANTQVDDQGHC